MADEVKKYDMSLSAAEIDERLRNPYPAVSVTALEGLGDEDGMLTFSEADAAKLDAATQTPGPIFLTVIAGDEAAGFTVRALMNNTVSTLWGSAASIYSALVYFQDMFAMMALMKTEDSGWTLGMLPMSNE